MEGRKQKGTSSSFTSELFGSKESHSSSSSGIFGSIFSPPTPKIQVLGRESLRSELNRKSTNEAWSSKIGTQDYIYKSNDGETQNTANKDMSSIYQEQRVQPCSLSSSIYYGGQDIYATSQSTQNAALNSSDSGMPNYFVFNSKRTMREKMIQNLLQEETGGKGLSIIKIALAKGYTPQGK